MPAKNLIKQYAEDGIYHIYNRGVAKNDIFLDEEDYKTFLFYLKIYLSDPLDLKKDLPGSDPSRIERKNFHGKIQLLNYCLMPNHIHLLIKQGEISAITEFMRCIMTNYVMYFNAKYERVGPLFQGKFKAILVDKDEYLLHLSRYIHINPSDLPGSDPIKEYTYSSYADYIGHRNTKWVSTKLILSMFGSDEDGISAKQLLYKEFVEDNKGICADMPEKLTID